MICARCVSTVFTERLRKAISLVLSAGDELQHFALARGQHLGRGFAAGAMHVAFDHLARDRRAEPALAAHHATQRELELARRGVLEEVTDGAGAQRLGTYSSPECIERMTTRTSG